MNELENQVMALVTLSPLTRAEIFALLGRVAARVASIPVKKVRPAPDPEDDYEERVQFLSHRR